MARLNLICHGMMLFVEGDKSLNILVPEIDQHDFRIGSPGGTSCGPFPVELPSARYDLTGIAPGSAGGLQSLDPGQHLLLHADKFTVVGRPRITIAAPKPNRVHLFRQVRPSEGSTADVIFGNVPRDTALGEPDVLHDIIALIFEGIADGTTVAFGTVQSHVLSDAAPTNICVYSQVGPSSMPNDTGTRARHDTGLNALLELRDGRHPEFMLSAVGEAATHTGPIPDGINRCNLFSLFELAHFTTDGTGCSSAFVLSR